MVRMLTRDEVASGIVELMSAGKNLPPPITPNINSEVYVNQIVDIWFKNFKDTAKDVWDKALNIASTISEIKNSNLNLNVATPALMAHALQEAELYIMTEKQKALEKERLAESIKHSEGMVSEETPEQTKALFAWTFGALANRGEKFSYMPTDEEMLQYKAAKKIADDVWKSNYSAIKTYVCDLKWHKATGKALTRQMFICDDKVVRFKNI